MTIGINVQPTYSKLGTPIAEVIARGDVTVLTSVDEVQAAGMNITQGNEQPPAWQGDSTTGRLAPDVPGGLHFEKVLVVTESAPVPLTQQQQDLE